ADAALRLIDPGRRYFHPFRVCRTADMEDQPIPRTYKKSLRHFPADTHPLAVIADDLYCAWEAAYHNRMVHVMRFDTTSCLPHGETNTIFDLPEEGVLGTNDNILASIYRRLSAIHAAIYGHPSLFSNTADALAALHRSVLSGTVIVFTGAFDKNVSEDEH